MGYDVQGTFYEACDCEIICSCWAGQVPDMGSCTGLWAWQLNHGSVIDTEPVGGSSVVVLFQGKNCDNADHMLVLVSSTGAGATAIRNVLQSAYGPVSPWRDVLRTMNAGIEPEFLIEAINIAISPEKSIVATAVRRGDFPPRDLNVSASAYMKFPAYAVLRANSSASKDVLPNKAVGSAQNKDIKAGYVIVDPNPDPVLSTGDGLNLLADVLDSAGNVTYTFDLDITGVSAVTGEFRYTVPPNP